MSDIETWGWLILVLGGVIMLVAGIFMPSKGKASGVSVGVIAFVVGLFMVLSPGLGLDSPDDQQALGGKSYNLTWTESDAHLTSNIDTNTFSWAVQYNPATSSFAAGTGSINVTFTIDRTDGLDEDASVSGNLVYVPVGEDSSGDDVDLISEADNGKYNFVWTRGGTPFYENVNIKVEAFGSGDVSLYIELDPEAFEGVDLYDTFDITGRLAGELLTFHVIYAASA